MYGGNYNAETYVIHLKAIITYLHFEWLTLKLKIVTLCNEDKTMLKEHVFYRLL